MSSEPRSDAQAAMQSKDNKTCTGTLRLLQRSESKNAPEITPHGAERLDRRDEVINEALAEEVRRREQLAEEE